ncbi:MAG: DUF1570 domain-containing protein [Planctomycetota bacterium]
MVTVLSILTLFALSAAAQPSDFETYRSRHYVIHTDLSKAEVAEYGRHMDAVFVEFQRRFDGFRSRRSDRMPLYLFAERAAYVDFLANLDIDATNSGGMFFVRPRASGLATWIGDQATSRVYRVLQHEGFHQFAWAYVGEDLPVWVNEGLAQYFEDAIFTGRRMRTGLADARRIDLVRDAIVTQRAIDIDEIVSLTGAAWSDTLAADPQRASLLYAQSWSLVYYLIHGRDGRYRDAFQRYLVLLSDGQRSARAIRDAFGVDSLTGIERLWTDHALAQQPDPVTAAAERLDFLGVALRYLHQHDQPIPKTLDDLREMLVQRAFTVTRVSHGLTVRLSAADADLFTFDRPGGLTTPFRMLAPARNDLPPRLDAPGLDPEPHLAWHRDDAGQLIYEIEYR